MQGKERSATALDGCVTTQKRLSSATNQEPDVAPGSDTGQYLCMECSETFSSKVQLSSHRQSHIAKKPFMCSYCGRGFHHQIFLQVHERSHEGGATSHQLTAAKPSATRIISTRSCRPVTPLTSDCVNVQPTPSKPELLLNSLVQFRKGHGSQQSPAPIECVTRLSRCQVQPCVQRKDSAEKKSSLELRVSRYSDTTVHLMDAFGNSIELLTEVFSTYTMNGPKQALATGTIVPGSEDLSPCEQRTDRTQQEKNNGEMEKPTSSQSDMPPPLVPHTDTPTVCPVETDVSKMESDLSPGVVVCNDAPSVTPAETPMHNESERLTSSDPVVPIETLDGPLSKGTAPISVPHVKPYQVSTETDSSLDGMTVSSPPSYSQSVLTKETDYVPEMESLEETHNFPIPSEQKQNGSLLAEGTSMLEAEDVKVPGTAQAGGLPEYQEREAPIDHSEQVGEIDTFDVGISALRTDIAMTSELDSQSDMDNGDHKFVLGQNTQSGVKDVSLVQVNNEQIPSHETVIDLKLSLVRDTYSAATVQGTDCSRGTETTSANVGISHQQGQDLRCDRNVQQVLVHYKAEDGSFPKPPPGTGAGDSSEIEDADHAQTPPATKDDYVMIHTNSAASMCDRESTDPESQDKDDQVSATYRHGQDLRSQEPVKTPAESLNSSIVDHDYSDQRRTLKDTPVLSSPITVDMAREFGDGQYKESQIISGIHDVPPIGEENSDQLGGHAEQEQHSLNKKPDLQEGISGNVETFAESGTAETPLVLSKDGESQATGDLQSHDIMDSALTAAQNERSECKEDISRWVSPIEASFQENAVTHETEKGTNAQIGSLAEFIPTPHHDEAEMNCVGKRSLAKSAPMERKEENNADVALSASNTDEVEMEGTVPCLTCGEQVNGNKSPSHKCFNFSKSSMTVMENKSIEMIPADVKQDLDSAIEPPNLKPEEPDAKVNKMYNCPKCDKTFKLPVLLAGHMKCHTSHPCITCGSPMPHKYKMKRLARKCQQCIQNTIVKRQKKRFLSSHYSEEDMVTSGAEFSTDLNEDTDLNLSFAPNTEGMLGVNSAIELTQLKHPCMKQRAKSAVSSLGMEPCIESSEVRKKRGKQSAKGDLIPATVPKVYKCLQCGVSFLQCMFIVKHMKEHSMAQTQPCKCYLIVRREGKQTLKQCKVCREHTKSTALDPSKLTESASEQNPHIHALGPKKIIKRVRKEDMQSQRADKKIPQKRGKYARKSMATVRECHDEPHLEKKSQIPPLEGDAEVMSTSWEESFVEQSVSGRVTDKRAEDLLLKPHLCDVCGKAFRLPRYLRLHMVTHTGTICKSCGCLFRYKRRAGRPSKKCRLCRMKGKEHGVLSDPISKLSPPELPKAHKAKVLSSLPHGKQSKMLSKLKAPNQAKLCKAFKEKKLQLFKGPLGHSKKRKLSSMQPEKSKKMPKSVQDLSPPTPKKRGRPPGKPSAHRMLSTLNSPSIKSETKSVAVSDGQHPIEITTISCSGDGKSDDVPTYQILPTMSIKEEPNASEIPSFPCSECGQNFPYKHLLDNHMQTHMGDRPYACSDCDKCFAKINHLTIHKRVHTGVRPHVCSVCQSSFRQKSSLLAHRYTHTNQPPLLVTSYECSVCLKEFKQNSDLEAHECILPVELPVQCKDCDRVFTNKGRLAVHSRVHTVQKSYPCPICNRSFIYKANLERHQQKHKGEKPFSCAKCGVSFVRRKTLERHKLAHGKKGLFSCIHCKKYFLLQTWLFRHLKICQGLNKGKVLKAQKRKRIKENVEVSSTVSSEEDEKKIIKVENKQQKIKKLMKSKVLGDAKLKSKAAEGSKEEKLKAKAARAEKGALKKKLTEGVQEKGEGGRVEEKRANEEGSVKRDNKQEQIKKGQREFPEGANTSDGKPKSKGAAPVKKELLSEEKQKAKSAKKDMLGEEKQKAKGGTTAKKESDGDEQHNVKVAAHTNKELLGEDKMIGKGATTTKKESEEEKQKARNVIPAKKEIIGDEKQKTKGTPPAKKSRLERNPKGTTPERIRKEGGKGKEPQGKLQSGTGKK